MKEFRVVRIVDGNNIIINAGSLDGLSKFAEFKIFEDGDEIRDPITHESLGKLEKEKDIVEVCELMDKMCVCKKKLQDPFKDFGDDMLNVEESEIKGGLKSDNPIKVGDKAKCIKGI